MIEGISTLSGLLERITLMTISLLPGVEIGVLIISTASIELCKIICLGMMIDSKISENPNSYSMAFWSLRSIVTLYQAIFSIRGRWVSHQMDPLAFA